MGLGEGAGMVYVLFVCGVWSMVRRMKLKIFEKTVPRYHAHTRTPVSLSSTLYRVPDETPAAYL